MIGKLITRNIKIFFRDRMGVFLSLLSSLILFVLYVVFLGKAQANALQRAYPLLTQSSANHFIYNWVFAGILLVTIVSTSLSAIHVFATDRISGTFGDFLVSPIKRWKIIIAYFGSSYFISMAMTTIAFIFSTIYLGLTSQSWIPAHDLLITYIYVLFLGACFSGVSSLIASFIKSESAYTSIGVILGTLVGFFAAVYVPNGALPSGVSNVINVLPYAEAAALIRKPFTSLTLHNMSSSPAVQHKVATYYGINPTIGSHVLATTVLVLAIAVIGVLCLLGATMNISRRLR